MSRMLNIEIGNFDFTLPVHISTLTYLSDEVSAEEMWNLRGMTGLKRHQSEIENKDEQVLERFKKDPERKKILDTFLEGVFEIFESLINEPDKTIEKYLPDRNFYFIVGHMRTGGTYLLRNLMNLHGMNLEDFNQKFIHDYCPTYEYLLGMHKNKKSRVRSLFEFAQMLEWMRQRFEEGRPVFKKRIAFAHTMGFLDTVFADQADYLVTIRSPGEAVLSYVDLNLGSSEDRDFTTEDILESPDVEPAGWKDWVPERLSIPLEDWDRQIFLKKYLLTWKAYYLDIVRDGLPDGEFVSLPFGPGHREYLENHRKLHGLSAEIDHFSPTPRDTEQYFDGGMVEEVVGEVMEKWSQVGIDAPSIDELLNY